ncbi:ABC-type phosphate transport system, periplasmic component [Serpentinimonas raichei]|uniref:Phosphate-binding protein PstS n=1 Tax=Serpentinimonas raichei TaxID=1458425 RepID=A0A060NQE5_9BURK|nr:phosphate ABC transporter substrate-binding protein PstS [Serpentinimonas raichei]BAO81134.1 ABC-type phosphate transport system, periplasmic component [Serpentinimonas raichei]
MKRTFLKTVAATAALAMTGGFTKLATASTIITGAGASLPFPIYSRWAEAYQAATGVRLNYQSIGSSAGIRQIRARTVTFGATDAPVSGADLERDGMVQFPAIIAGTVPMFNLEGFRPGEVRITGPVLADMFLGRIVNWSDPRIAALNPGRTFPNQAITVVHRADGSGTTFNFTEYLTAVSPDWASTVGRGASVRWPAASSIGGRGNEGLAAIVARTRGAVGYVEFSFARRNNIPHMQLQNAAGNFVQPDDRTFSAAAAGVDWFSVPGMGVSIVNAAGANAWPIATASFILMYRQPANVAESNAVLAFFDWAFRNGDQMAIELDFVPIPDTLADAIRARVWNLIQRT